MEYGKGYVSLFANRMVDSHIIEMSENNLEKTLQKANWKEILKQNKEKYFDKAWNFTIKEIAYVAREANKTDCELIVGSIRTPEDVYKIASANPQIITIPANIVRGIERIEDLNKIEKILKDSVYLGNSINHPMTTYTLKEFENSAKGYRNN